VLIGIVALVAIGTIIRAVRPPEPVGPQIRIGIIGPMRFMPGKHHWWGAQMAAEEINAAGGVNVGGVMHRIGLIKADDNSMLSIPDAVSAIERIITVDRVDFIVGGWRTEAALAQQEVMADHRVVWLNAGTTHPEPCMRVAADYQRYRYFFRVAPVNSIYVGKMLFGQVDMVAREIRQELGIKTPKVAILAEKAVWTDPIVAAAHRMLPELGIEVVGVWRPSAVAVCVAAELTAIRAAGAHMIMAILSGPVGVVFARQWGELEIPAASVGVNAEAQGAGFWEATGGKGNYVLTANSLARVQITEKTIPFFDRFVERFGEFPIFTAGTYDAIYILKEAIERAGTLDSNAVIAELKKTDYIGAGSRIVFTGMDSPYPHDLTWGPGYATGVGTQWRDGELLTVWPDGQAVLGDERWVGLKYEGTVDYVLPPWMVEYWRGSN